MDTTYARPLYPTQAHGLGDCVLKEAAASRDNRGISWPLDLLALYPLARRSRSTSVETAATNKRANMMVCTGL